jgi:hypothetical protein
MLLEAERVPQIYDEDCPKLSPRQLAEFRPVNGITWEERARLKQEHKVSKLELAGITAG